MQIKRNFRPILNVGQLINGPVRYDKPSEPAGNPAPGTGVSPEDYRNHMMQRAEQSRAYAEQQRKLHPTQPPAPKPETPGFWETYTQVPGKLLDVAKDKIDPITNKIPLAHAASSLPGKIYNGVANVMPNAIKDARIAGYRVGDAADAVAQTFSPVSLDPNATPTDHAAQAALAFTGQKVLGKGAQALGKHGGKIIDGVGLGAMFGPDAVAGAADHAARMFGREVPSLAAAGEARALSPRAMHMPQRSNMAASGPGPSGPPPVPSRGMAGTAWDGIKSVAGGAKRYTWDQLPAVTRAQAKREAGNWITRGVIAVPATAGILGASYLARHAAERADAMDDSPETKRRIANIGKGVGRIKKASDEAYKDAADYLKEKKKKNAERKAEELKRKQQGAN